jgi:large subunit ribosomal protein L1
MGKLSKKYKKALEMYDRTKKYSLDEAIRILKELPKAKFDESVDISVKLNLNKGQRIRSNILFPHSFGNTKKVLVFAKGEKAEEAKKAGADYVGDIDLIEKIQNGFMDFDIAISTPDMMKDVSKLGPILGKKGLMPNPKSGTVTFEIKKAVEEAKKGKREFRSDKDGVVNISVGKISMDDGNIIENIKAFYEVLVKTRPADVKGEYIKSVALSKTMSPSVRIDIKSLI